MQFLDALRTTADALRISVHALRERRRFRGSLLLRGRPWARNAIPATGGVRSQSTSASSSTSGWRKRSACNVFDIGARADVGYVVRPEECHMNTCGDGAERFFRIEHGRCAATSLT